MEFYDLQTKIKSKDINLLFPNWEQNSERVVIFSPHDDDVILGAGYALISILENKGEVSVIIFNDGSAGYSNPELKERIVKKRKNETYSALSKLGIKKEKIIRLEIPDFSCIHYLGWKLPWIQESDQKNEGLFTKIVGLLREIKATRLILPNGYREHMDHTAVSLCALFDGPQAGDPVIVDYGKPFPIKSYLQYSVWAKFSPEDSILHERSDTIRANRAVLVNKEIEKKIQNSILEFKTQENIISAILETRKERKLENNDRYIELYLDIDPRPRFDYDPYKNLISKIDRKLLDNG